MNQNIIPQTSAHDNPEVKNKFHLYSDGHGQLPIFSSPEIITLIVNMMATLSLQSGVTVLVYHIMSNHIHIVLDGPPEKCQHFATQLKRLLSFHFNRFGIEHSAFRISLDRIPDRDALLTVFSYVFRNGIDAGYSYLPAAAATTPGNIYFMPPTAFVNEGIPLSGLSRRKRMKLFRSDAILPDDWRCNENGMILPQCFVDWKQVNSVFKTVKTFLAFMHLRKSDIAELDLKGNRRMIETISEKEVMGRADEVCVSLYGKHRKDCSFKEKLSAAKTMWSGKDGYSLKQIARSLGIDSEFLESVMGKGSGSPAVE